MTQPQQWQVPGSGGRNGSGDLSESTSGTDSFSPSDRLTSSVDPSAGTPLSTAQAAPPWARVDQAGPVPGPGEAGNGYPPVMAAPQTPERGSGLSVTAFVLGLVGFLPPLALAAVVVGVVALVRRQTIRPLAIAGLVLGLVWTAGSIAFWSSGMPARIGEAVSAALEEAAEPGDSDEFAWALPGGMPVGACLNDSTVYQQPWDEATTAEQIDEVDCSQPHDLEVYELAILPDGEYPGDWEIEELAYDACIAAFEPFIGVPYARSEIEIFYYYPLQASWEYADDREVVCTVTDFEGPTTGTLKGADR